MGETDVPITIGIRGPGGSKPGPNGLQVIQSTVDNQVPNSFGLHVANNTSEDLSMKNRAHITEPSQMPGWQTESPTDRIYFGIKWTAGTEQGDLFGVEDESTLYVVSPPAAFNANRGWGSTSQSTNYWILWPTGTVLLPSEQSVTFPITNFITTAPTGQSWLVICACLQGYLNTFVNFPIYKEPPPSVK